MLGNEPAKFIKVEFNINKQHIKNKTFCVTRAAMAFKKHGKENYSARKYIFNISIKIKSNVQHLNIIELYAIYNILLLDLFKEFNSTVLSIDFIILDNNLILF